MTTYWVIRPGKTGNEPVKLEGAQVDPSEGIMSVPFKPFGSSLHKRMEVEVDGASRKPKASALEKSQLERLPVDTVLQIPDNGTNFEALNVRPLGEGAVDPITDDEIAVLGKVIRWAESGRTFSREQVLRQTLVDIAEKRITTTNDLFAGLRKMGPEELMVVRDVLKANIMVMARDVENVSDMQFIFAMQLLSGIGDEGDRKTTGILLGKIMDGFNEKMNKDRTGGLTQEGQYEDLLNLLSTGDIREIGNLKKESINLLYELTGRAEREMHEEKTLHNTETPVLAVLLKAACIRVDVKLAQRK